MQDTLHWHTVNENLAAALKMLMKAPQLYKFRLVGGTALSLQLGHRVSVDIDLFTDELYDTIDFAEIDKYLRSAFDYVSPSRLPDIIAMGMPYFVGRDAFNSIKLDLYYTDTFMQPSYVCDGIRLATIEEIVAMKIYVVQRTGRKKIFGTSTS